MSTEVEVDSIKWMHTSVTSNYSGLPMERPANTWLELFSRLHNNDIDHVGVVSPLERFYNIFFNSISSLLFFTLPIIAFFHSQNLAYIRVRLSSIPCVSLCLSQIYGEKRSI